MNVIELDMEEIVSKPFVLRPPSRQIMHRFLRN